MELTVTLKIENADQLEKLQALLGEAPKTKTPAKKAKAAPVEDVEEDEYSAYDKKVNAEMDAEEEAENVEEEAENVEDEDLDDAEDEALSKSEITKLKGALNAYSVKYGKDKAVKALHKFARTTSEVTKEQLPKLLKLLKV